MRQTLARFSSLCLPWAIVACSDAGRARPPADGEAHADARTAAVAPLPPDALAPGVTAAMVADGERLYRTACIACHGPDGAGTQLGPSHRDSEWIHVDGTLDSIVELIRTGVPAPEEHPVPMPPLGGGDFDDEQVRALAAYVFSLSRR